MRVWLCEKFNQASDLAKVLGVVARSKTWFETREGRVVWAVGHLLQQAPPERYDPALETWSLETLPIIPAPWKLESRRSSAAQLSAVGECLKSASEVVIATDADREGESIARELLEWHRYRGPVRRLWFSALDERSIRAALSKLREGATTEPLHWAAQARSRADWLVGMNLSRAATLHAQGSGMRGLRSVGRVQTPTLALVVKRDREIENFVPRAFYEIAASVDAGGVRVQMRYAPAAHPEDRRIYDRETADALAQRAQGAHGPLHVETKRCHEAPPALFSLSRLQSACSAKWGWSADKTLQVAQALYETHKLTTYPRTNCQFLPAEQGAEVGEIVRNLASLPELAPAALRLAPPVGAFEIRDDVFDTAKVTAHHAIIPTTLAPDPSLSSLSQDERQAYLLIARHYLAALYPDAQHDETRFVLDANGVPLTAVGRVPRVAGWRTVFGADVEEEDRDVPPPLPALADGTLATVREARVDGKETKPPRPYTEGTLIMDMTSVAKFATDPQVRARLKETSGIGTEATRHSILKVLRERGYLEPKGKAIRSTQAGRELVDALPPEVTDAALTALWEDRLDRIAGGDLGEAGRDAFVARVVDQVNVMLAKIRQHVIEAPAGGGLPSKKMLQVAQSFADQLGMTKLPAQVETSFAACSAFIDKHKPEIQARRDVGRPTDKQVAWAKQLAGRCGIELPPDALTDRKACSDFIEQNKIRS